MADLSRFHQAQAGTFDTALAELASGRKQGHWMWFIFPQLASLGRSPTAKHFGIRDLAEAQAYLADPVLADRLRRCAQAVLAHKSLSAREMLGTIDAMKLRSSATLFAAAGGGPEQQAIIDAFFEGVPCPLTLAEIAERRG